MQVPLGLAPTVQRVVRHTLRRKKMSGLRPSFRRCLSNVTGWSGYYLNNNRSSPLKTCGVVNSRYVPSGGTGLVVYMFRLTVHLFG
jgi:hypothetical protein